uniref:Homeobox domain-containing protein n=1 Tax=Gasterosteus aculeatus aculeatus TaxID=481459 RepID=A0AAQ4Q2F9_GASAC
MSSYFVNSTFPVTLPGTGAGGQSAESFLGQIPLYSSGYAADHPLRHYSGAAAVSAAATAYGASSGVVHQEKPYPAPSYYQQAANGAYGAHRAAQGVVGAGACDYAVAAAAAAAAATSFYRDKEHACTLEEHQLAMSQEGMHRKVECAGLSGKGVFGETMDDKLPSSAPIYPWMQRMNSCNELTMASSVKLLCCLPLSSSNSGIMHLVCRTCRDLRQPREARTANVHALPDARAGEGVPLQPVPHAAATHRDRARALPHGAAD